MKNPIFALPFSVAAVAFLMATNCDADAAQGLALTLDGVNDYASAPDANSLDLGTADGQGFTIEASFYVPDLNGEGLQTVIQKQNAYALFINFHTGSPDQVFFRIWQLGLPPPGYITLFSTPTDLSVGWHHVAATFDNQASQDTGATYLDGLRIGLASDINLVPGIGNSTSALNVGAFAGVNPFHGFIDEVRLSSVVRYTGASYTVPSGAFSSDANTRALWHYDEVAGSTNFSDASGNGNTLTGSNGAQTSTLPGGDTTPPTVLSVTRLNPPVQLTSAAGVTQRVTFSESVNNVSTADLTLVDVSGTITGESISSVSGSSGSVLLET